MQTRGVLLYGLPGTGKTHFARAVAKETGSNMLSIDPSMINDSLVGESEKYIRAAFSLAKKLHPCVIFIDEADSLFYRRESHDRTWERSSLTQFLQEMDGIKQDKKSPFILAASNRPEDLDTAFLRRLPQKIPFSLPNHQSRAEILRLNLTEEELDGVDIDYIASSTEGYSGSDLKSLCGHVARIWLQEHGFRLLANGLPLKPRLTKEHFDMALKRMKPSVSEQDTKSMARFTERFGPDTETRGTTQHEESRRAKIGKSIYQVSKLSAGAVPIISPIDGCQGKVPKTMDYKDIPLPTSTSIRLLKLYTLQDGNLPGLYDKIRFSVVSKDLEDHIDYFALSYTWGDPRTIYTSQEDIFPSKDWSAATHGIYKEDESDERPVMVGANLYAALITIRAGLALGDFARTHGDQYQAHNPGYSYIWIDALCINQDSKEEKNQQVPLMDRIYSQARATFMWLGGAEELVTKGVQAIGSRLHGILDRLEEDFDIRTQKATQEMLGSVHLCGSASLCESFDICDPLAYSKIGIDPIEREELIGWFLFINRAWFSRAWIIQEWALSPNCIFVTGDITISARAFAASKNTFQHGCWLSSIGELIQRNTVNLVMMDKSPEALHVFPVHDAYHGPTNTTWARRPTIFELPPDYEHSMDLVDTLATVESIRERLGHDISDSGVGFPISWDVST